MSKSSAQHPSSLVVEAVLVTLRGPGFEREYCIDTEFYRSVAEKYRSLLFVYPREYCENITSESVLEKGARIVEDLKDSCREARRIVEEYRPTPSEFLRRVLFLRFDERAVRHEEARIAVALCETVFGEQELDTIVLEHAYAAQIRYEVGDERDAKWKRLARIARIDSGVLEKLVLMLPDRGVVEEKG